MPRTASLVAACALLALLPAPSRGQGADTPPRVASLVHDDLGLYFEEAELTLVESATRAPKPITQVAENVTVITSQEIERWNAFSLDEVINRVAGVNANFLGREVNSGAALSIQGSDFEHVQVYVDGMRWNDMANDYYLTNQIPVEIIDRVEVIKGPAASTWGSAFGGVVNIITKGAGSRAQPTGSVSAALGERGTLGTSAQVAGSAGPMGYFLHAGILDSDGLKDDRWLDSDSLYLKLSTPLPARTTLTVTMGQSNLANNYFVLRAEDYGALWDEQARFATATLSRPLTAGLRLLLYGSLLDRGYHDLRGALSSPTDSWSDYSPDQSGHSGAARIYGDIGRHALSLGADIYRNVYDESQDGVLGPETIREETWSVYANDTVRWGRFTVTPGLRYDSLSIADPQLSPSLGLTCRVNDHNLIRLFTTRGFRRPVPNLMKSNWWPDYVNPELESEIVHSYQAGIESVSIPLLRVKATLFRHQADHTWAFDPEAWIWVNDGAITRNGVELEVDSERWHGLGILANHTFVDLAPESGPDPGDISTSNLILDYQGPWGVSGRLGGSYVWWNSAQKMDGAKNGTMLWDLTASKVVRVAERYRFDLFVSVYNLFNGSQYSMTGYPNPERWTAAGLRLRF